MTIEQAVIHPSKPGAAECAALLDEMVGLRLPHFSLDPLEHCHVWVGP